MALVNRKENGRYVIPTSLTHSSGTITAVVNQVGYSVNLSGLSANTLYFLYLRINSGTTQLFFSAIVPSSYRASFSEALLVGAFYSNGNSSPAFGSFINIEGVPKTSNEIPFVGSGTWTNTTYSGFWERDGKNLKCQFSAVCTAAPSGGSLLLSIPFSTMELNAFSGKRAGLTYVEDNGITGYDGLVYIQSVTQIGPAVLNTASTYGGSNVVSTTAPISFNTGDFITVTKFDMPLTAFNTTPLKDL